MMKDVEIIGCLKSYVNQVLVGMGVLKGAPCMVKSVVDSGDTHTITLEWEDTEGTTHETEFTVKDGAKGDPGQTGQTGQTGPAGADGTDGFSPTITVKTSTGDTYILTITDAKGSYDTPNLKGSGGGGASALSDLTDVDLTNLAVGDMLVYSETTDAQDQTVGFWVVAKPLTSISVNGVAQTISQGAVNLDIASNLITETQWSSISALYS